jgi:hypothetical protein
VLMVMKKEVSGLSILKGVVEIMGAIGSVP